MKEDISEETRNSPLTKVEVGKVLSEGLGSLKVSLPEPPRSNSHLRALYFDGNVENLPLKKIFFDNGSAVNILPWRVIQKLGKEKGEMERADVKLTGFSNVSSCGNLPVR